MGRVRRGRWIVGGIAALLVAAGVIVVVAAVDPFSGGDVVTRFASPSGRKVIVVTETCFIKGCGNRAELEGRFWNTPLGSAQIDGDPEGPVFKSATVKWNADETEATWETHFRHQGSAHGVWVVK
jgi:hypothetical protein